MTRESPPLSSRLTRFTSPRRGRHRLCVIDQEAWDIVVNTPTTGMPGRWGELPTFVIPPVSIQRGAWILPRWKVYAELISESLEPPTGTFGGGSQLVLVFFCNDIASKPITEVIGWQLASWDEAAWRRRAADWEP